MTLEKRGEPRMMRHEAATRPFPPTYDRRLGSRIPVAVDAPVSWLPLTPAKRFRRPRQPQRAWIIDLSVTGARINAPTDRPIVRGSHVEIEVNHARGIVRVRRIDATANPAMALYGVEFLQLDPPLQDLMSKTLAAHRPNQPRWD